MFGMSRTKNILFSKSADDDVQVEFIGLIDESSEAEARGARIQAKLANIIALGLKRGRPRMEDSDHEKVAA
jgi:hypothetical protein